MGRPRSPHGTQSAFRAHKREGTRICDLCQAWKDGESPLEAAKAEIQASADRLEAQKRAREPRESPANPRERSKRRIDPLAETFDNLDTVQAALDLALSNDVARVPALSKRKSELIAEITALGGVIEAEEKPDKLNGLLDGAAEVTGGDNVIGFRKATA